MIHVATITHPRLLFRAATPLNLKVILMEYSVLEHIFTYFTNSHIHISPTDSGA